MSRGKSDQVEGLRCIVESMLTEVGSNVDGVWALMH